MNMTISQLSIPLGHLNFPANFYRSLDHGSARMGKVAIIRDMAAVTYAKTPATGIFPYLTDSW